ncbi:MAG: hypothetical protein H7Z41_11970 [Cytophagales bacterium]|nr:hypothetical protein [Armatimonadota bacterium]
MNIRRNAQQRIFAATLATAFGLVSGVALLAPLSAAARQSGSIYRSDRFGNPLPGGTQDSFVGNRAVDRTADNRLEATFSTDRAQYREGQSVQIRLSQENLLDREQPLAIPGNSLYEVTIRENRTRRVVWSRQVSPPRGGTSFRRREVKRWTETWDPSDVRIGSAGGGGYTVEARLYPHRLLTTQVTVSGSNNGGNGGENGDYRLSALLATGNPRIRSGDTATLLYTVTNTGRERRTYRFSSGKQFDMEAVRVDVRAPRGGNRGYGGGGGRQRLAWRLSDDEFYTQALTEFALSPNQRRTFTARWRTDRNLPSGTYEVTAYLTPLRGERIAAATARVIVRNDRSDD